MTNMHLTVSNAPPRVIMGRHERIRWIMTGPGRVDGPLWLFPAQYAPPTCAHTPPIDQHGEIARLREHVQRMAELVNEHSGPPDGNALQQARAAMIHIFALMEPESMRAGGETTYVLRATGAQIDAWRRNAGV